MAIGGIHCDDIAQIDIDQFSISRHAGNAVELVHARVLKHRRKFGRDVVIDIIVEKVLHLASRVVLVRQCRT